MVLAFTKYGYPRGQWNGLSRCTHFALQSIAFLKVFVGRAGEWQVTARDLATGQASPSRPEPATPDVPAGTGWWWGRWCCCTLYQRSK